MVISALAMPITSFVNAAYFTLRSGGKTLITFLFDSCFMWGVTVVLAYVLSRYTSISILPLFFYCQMVDIIKCVIGYALLKKGIWVRNIVDQDGAEDINTSIETV
jgi:Na+-driven multidrug efflux pump